MTGSSSSIGTARTWLFVPGDRPDRFAKARRSGADVAIIDLEDAVDAAQKDKARQETAASIAEGNAFAVRISAVNSADGAKDLEMLAGIGRSPLAIIAAKAEDPEDMALIARTVRAPVIALIESARGLEAASDLAASSAVARLALGAVDLSLDAGFTLDDRVLAPIRSRLVISSRAAGIAGPIDTPSLDIRDLDAVRTSTLQARRFGMAGKLCIHPAQVPVVSVAFRPTAAEVEHARTILATARDGGAAQLNGQMIDLPVLERARRVIADAESTMSTDIPAGKEGAPWYPFP